jgi:hypothetical protein
LRWFCGSVSGDEIKPNHRFAMIEAVELIAGLKTSFSVLRR